MKDRAHDEAMADMFRDDPDYAVQLLNSILEDGDQSELLITLRQMTKMQLGILIWKSCLIKLQVYSQVSISWSG